MNNPIATAFNNANQLLEQNRLVEAEQLYRHILARFPQHHGAWHGLGLVAFKNGNIGLAIQQIVRAICINREIGLYHRNLAELFRQNGDIDKAIEAGETATALLPDDPAAFYNLALAYADRGQADDAIVCYKVTISLAPGHVMALNNLGTLHAQQGNMDEARQCLYEAIIRKPDHVEAHYNLSALKRYSTDDKHLHILEALEQTAEELPLQAQARLFFTLGKAHEDCRNYRAAFAAYARANHLQRKLTPYDEAADIRNHKAIQHTFTRSFLEAKSGLGTSDASAIFIVGMPRSGTTLVEQILSSHSAIAGAGEIATLTEVMDEFSGTDRLFYPQTLQDEDFARLGRAYSDKLLPYRDEAGIQWVCNKTPNNFLHLGLIKLLLPNARIIHVLRDPMDSCFSCYAKLFSSPVSFSYQLEELGRYYVRYREMMAYWEQVLPAGSIYTVEYEKLVSDFEPQARALLDHVGVEWEDSCLQFQDNRRQVNTASIAQVRQPLYSSSVARWQHFSDELEPLMAIVRDWRPS